MSQAANNPGPIGAGSRAGGPRSADRVDEHGVVIVSVRIAAEQATVWRFLTDGPRFAAWIGSFGGQPPLEGTNVEPRIGGKIRVCYPGGAVSGGRITALDPPRRIAFTWGSEDPGHGLPLGSSAVEITLSPEPDGTLVELRHSGLPGDEMRRSHVGGWRHYLSMLALHAAGGQQEETLSGVLDAYYKAWAEPDDAARLRLLHACCEPTVRVRTSFACTDTIEELSTHIAASLKHMPGMTLAPAGRPALVHGHALAPWLVQAPSGQAVLRGANAMQLSLEGKIATLVSFPQG